MGRKAEMISFLNSPAWMLSLAVKESLGVALTITFRGLAGEENSDDPDSFDGAVVAVLICVYTVLR
ncbi:hypothetical protein OROHE_018633 [Orobanche hederae]